MWQMYWLCISLFANSKSDCLNTHFCTSIMVIAFGTICVCEYFLCYISADTSGCYHFSLPQPPPPQILYFTLHPFMLLQIYMIWAMLQ